MDSQLYDGLPIVDAHRDLWDLEGDLTYPWMASGEHAADQGDNSAFRPTYLSQGYRHDVAPHPDFKNKKE